MSLSCECSFDTGDFDLWWHGHSAFKLMGYRFTNRKRCCSCTNLINVNEDVLEFYMYRRTEGFIEESIYGDEKNIASKFMCEDCSGLFLALDELGYCVDIWEPMPDQIAEYNLIRLELQEKIDE